MGHELEFGGETVYAHHELVTGEHTVVSRYISAHDADRKPEELWEIRLAYEAEMEALLAKCNPVDVYWEGYFWRTIRLGLQGLGVFRRGVANADCPVLTRTTISCSGLPTAFDGFRILFLSDFHFSERYDHGGALERLLKGIAPDLVALGGDYEYRMFAPEAWVTEGIRRLRMYLSPPLGWVAVLGNNDRSVMVSLLEQQDVRVLVNRAIPIERGEDRIWIAGVDDPHDFRSDSVSLAMKAIPAGVFSILMAHSPEVIAAAAAHHVDLYLCGHTHGGQICIPGWMPLYTNTRCPRRYTHGPWCYDAMQGYTSSGLGTSALPIRFACPPEAVLITLKKEQQS